MTLSNICTTIYYQHNHKDKSCDQKPAFGIFADRYLRFALVNVVTVLTRTEKIRGIICVKQPAKLRTKLREILIDRAIGAVSYKTAKSYPHASKMLQWIRVCISTSPSFMHTRMHLFNIRVCSLCLFNTQISLTCWSPVPSRIADLSC